MVHLLLDENMPSSAANVLREIGYAVSDVRDIGLDATPDNEIFAFAREATLTIVTRDVGFASTLEYPLGSHAGIVDLRVPAQLTTSYVNTIVVKALDGIEDQELTGAPVLVEPGPTRIRRPTSMKFKCDPPEL